MACRPHGHRRLLLRPARSAPFTRCFSHEPRRRSCQHGEVDDIAAQLASSTKRSMASPRASPRAPEARKAGRCRRRPGGRRKKVDAAEKKVDAAEQKVDANFRELSRRSPSSTWIASATFAATIAGFFAWQRTAVIDARRALKANQLLAIARDAALAFTVCFTAGLALLTYGFDVHMRRMLRRRQAASKP